MTLTRIAFFGCSLTYGQDCATNLSISQMPDDWIPKYPESTDRQDFYDDTMTYPALVGQQLGIEIENLGVPGYSNECIAQRFYEWTLHQDTTESTLIVINPTAYGRYSTSLLDDRRWNPDPQCISGRHSILGHHNHALFNESLGDHCRSVTPQAKLDISQQRLAWLNENDDYMVLRSMMALWGIKSYAESLGYNILFNNMLFYHSHLAEEPWYNADLYKLFECSDPFDRIIDMKSRAEIGKPGKYYTAYSRHFTSDGYKIVADDVSNIIRTRYL